VDLKELKQVVEIMQECWMEKASARLSSLTVKKKLKKISSDFLNS